MSEQLERPQLDTIITLLDQLIEELSGVSQNRHAQSLQSFQNQQFVYTNQKPIITEEEINRVLELLTRLNDEY